MRATYLSAVAIAVLLVSWLASGQLDQEAVAYEASIAERNAESRTLMSDQAPTQVRVMLSQAQMQNLDIGLPEGRQHANSLVYWLQEPLQPSNLHLVRRDNGTSL